MQFCGQQLAIVLFNNKGAFINYEGGEGGGEMSDLRGDLNIFYTEKGGDLKCFQNAEVRT